MLILQQVSEGAVGLLKCAQLLQEKFLLPRQGVDVRAGHLFFLEDSKKSYMVQGREGGWGRGAGRGRKELGCGQGQGGEDSFLEVLDLEGWAGSEPVDRDGGQTQSG